MIEKALFACITTDSTISALMGLRLFPNKIPQGQPMPTAEYKQEAGKREQMMSGTRRHGELSIHGYLLWGVIFGG